MSWVVPYCVRCGSDPLRNEHMQKARADERARIVAWIRSRAADYCARAKASGARAHIAIDGRSLRIPRVERELADAIERGDHRSGGEDG